MTNVYDFIIVGAGPAGISLATRLCRSDAQPSVLLLESGKESEQITNRIAGERLTFWGTGGTHLDHGYKTVPQNEIGGREIPYARGKGLGGSTLINIGVWDYGSKEEFNEWATLVGDDSWNWEHTFARFKQMENYHNETQAEYENYVKLGAGSHGDNGRIHVSLPKIWPPGLKEAFDAWREYGAPLNPDINSDKCIGFGMPPATTYQGLRITAASAYLKERPDNLTIKANSQVARVIFEAKKAVGVELSNKTRYISNKDILLSAGSIDTPKILLLSGVGDSGQLRTLDIPIILDQPSIGSNLRDHVIVRMAAAIKAGSFELPDPRILQEAREQWLHDRSGPLSGDTALLGIGYLKLPITSYPEYAILDPRTQALLSHSDVPAYEEAFGILPLPNLNRLILHTSNILMHSQSLGSISLKSADPKDPPNIDLNVLAHPYDRRIMIESVRETYGFLQKSIFPIEKVLKGPKSDSNADLLEYIKDHITTSWHALGTVKMGNEGEEGACVSSDFRVIGLANLRVVDLSVCPVLPSCHTQSVAYLIGETAADKIIKEYELDRKAAIQVL